jgi:signal transduction histidine kinase
MISAASGLSEDFSDGLLPVRGKDEFADLAEALNVSLGRSRDAFRRQQAVIAQLERFTADASHELKTPLASVKTGASYLVHLGELGPKDREIAEQVDRSADRMSQLIADLITLAKLDSGSSSDRIGRVGLAEVVAQGWPETVRVDVDPDLEVLGDKAALERVFANLIGNAVAYCRTEVVVSASRVGDRVMVEVRDDGAGIAPEHLARLGERFYRPDDARSRAEGGTGLGLAIAKSLVLAQGGRLRIESEVGVGTRVVVELVSG